MTCYDITTFGAVGDGQTLNTVAIQEAIDAACEAGGGTVLVPAGVFRTATLRLRSNMTLEVSDGAVLLGSDNMADYPALTETDGDRTPYHLIYIEGEQCVTIRGGGVIDGCGPSFWLPAPDGGTWMRHNNPHRPSPMVDIRGCCDVRIEDVTLANSGGWTIQFHHCDRVWARGVHITAPLFGPNTDGFDISGSADVLISNCTIACGDDAIVAFPSHERDCERVTVTGCSIRTNCAAFKAYLFPTHNVRDLVFTGSVVHASNRAVALYATGAGVIENVAVSNIVCDTNGGFAFNRPLHFDVRRGRKDSDVVGTIRNVQVSNMLCRTDGRILMTTTDGGTMENIVLRDVRMSYPIVDDPQAYADRIGGDQSSNHSPEAKAARAAVVAEGVTRLMVDNLMIDWPKEGAEPSWHLGPRAANGSTAWFPPINREAPPFHAVWGRRLHHALLRLPFAEANQPGVAREVLTDSDQVRIEM